jgi:predicted nucleic acid-binding protein
MVRLVRARASNLLGLALTAGLLQSLAREATGFDRAMARADEVYAHRAAGATAGVALPGPAEQAIAAYREALAVDPDSAGAHAGLLKALFFRATFCDIQPEKKKAITEEARAIADNGLERLERATDRPRREAEIQALRARPGSAELLFWVAVAWGEWAQNHSRFAAVRARAPSRIRDLAERVVEVDPDLRAYAVLPGERSIAVQALAERDPHWLAPRLWRWELRNVLATTMRVRRLPLSDALAAFAAAEQLVEEAGLEPSVEDCLRVAARGRISAWDAEFVCVAEALGVPFVTADRRLGKAFPECTVALEDAASSS